MEQKAKEAASHAAIPVSISAMLVTLGVVYGDIGTSPMYVTKALVAGNGGIYGSIKRVDKRSPAFSRVGNAVLIVIGGVGSTVNSVGLSLNINRYGCVRSCGNILIRAGLAVYGTGDLFLKLCAHIAALVNALHIEVEQADSLVYFKRVGIGRSNALIEIGYLFKVGKLVLLALFKAGVEYRKIILCSGVNTAESVSSFTGLVIIIVIIIIVYGDKSLCLA